MSDQEARSAAYCRDCGGYLPTGRAPTWPHACTCTPSAASTWARVQARRRTVCVYCGARIAGALTKAERRHKHRFSPEQILSARFTCMRHRNLPLDDPHYESLFGGRRVG